MSHQMDPNGTLMYFVWRISIVPIVSRSSKELATGGNIRKQKSSQDSDAPNDQVANDPSVTRRPGGNWMYHFGTHLLRSQDKKNDSH